MSGSRACLYSLAALARIDLNELVVVSRGDDSNEQEIHYPYELFQPVIMAFAALSIRGGKRRRTAAVHPERRVTTTRIAHFVCVF
jgi:hypothetical protein